MPKLLASNYYNELSVGGLMMRASPKKQADGRTLYSIEVDHTHRPTSPPKVKMPGIRIMRRLAKEYLNSDYTKEKDTREDEFLWYHFFEVQSGISLEKRAVFLAAVCTHCTLHENN
jgi:hypothetical protein